MRNKLLFALLLALPSLVVFSQAEQKTVRIVDTLTAQEKKSRNPILLRSELDSLIKLHEATQEKPVVQQPIVQEKTETPVWVFVMLGITVLAAGSLIWLFYQQRKKFDGISEKFRKQLQYLESYSTSSANGNAGENEKKLIIDMQVKTKDLNAKLEKVKAENDSLNVLVKEYSRAQAEYETLIKSIGKTFKVKKYPGSSEGKTDIESYLALFDTERSFTTHVYENFLKPINSIADANKNSPAHISKEQQDKLLELLVSLSLLYIEYLYLRISELSVGGNMVQRINDIKNGLALNPSLLKKLNTQNGSRALVVRLALEKINLQHLSYPVFEETDLNNR